MNEQNVNEVIEEEEIIEEKEINEGEQTLWQKIKANKRAIKRTALIIGGTVAATLAILKFGNASFAVDEWDEENEGVNGFDYNFSLEDDSVDITEDTDENGRRRRTITEVKTEEASEEETGT